MIFSFKLPAALLFFALGVSAAPAELSPLHLSKRDLPWSPTFLSPNASMVWCIGNLVSVKWVPSITNANKNQTSYGIVTIYLSTNDEPLVNVPLIIDPSLPSPVAATLVMVPVVDPRDDYVVSMVPDIADFTKVKFTFSQNFEILTECP